MLNFDGRWCESGDNTTGGLQKIKISDIITICNIVITVFYLCRSMAWMTDHAPAGHDCGAGANGRYAPCPTERA